MTFGDNLVGDPTGCILEESDGMDLIEADPQLGTLQNNGGETVTYALLGDSVAIDGGNPFGCIGPGLQPLITNQRGFPSPVDGDGDGSTHYDIGAYEFSRYLYLYLPLCLK